MTKETAVVTGAGSGIGRELVRRFIDEGIDVVAVSLLQTELDQLAADLSGRRGNVMTLQVDLTAPDGPASVYAYCQEREIVPDYLINNAGIGAFGNTVDTDPAQLRRLVDLNCTAVVEMSIRFGAVMAQRRKGRILNVGSSAGLSPAPRLCTYAASKAFVNSFTLGLGVELKGTGVSVTCLAPGSVHTGFYSGGVYSDSGASKIVKTSRRLAVTPAKVAETAYTAMMAGEAFATVGRGVWPALVLRRLVSQQRLALIAGKLG